MPYTTEEGGRLNNFAAEPKVYEAEPPSASQKRNYIIFGAIMLCNVTLLMSMNKYNRIRTSSEILNNVFRKKTLLFNFGRDTLIIAYINY